MPKLGNGESDEGYPKGWNDQPLADAATAGEALRNAVIVAVASVAVAGLGLFLYSSAYSPAHLTPDTPALLQTVLFSGAPYMVLCSKHPVKEALAKSPQHEVFGEAADIAYEFHVRAAVADCNAFMPGLGEDGASDDTLRKRYGLIKAKNHPLAFVVANGNKPFQIPVNHFSNSRSLVKFVRSHEKPKLIEPTSGGALVKHCLADPRRPCVLAHKDGKLQKPELKALRKVARAHRLVRLMYVNTKSYEMDVGAPALTGKGNTKLLRATVFRRVPDAAALKEGAAELALGDAAGKDAAAKGQAGARRFGGVRGGAAIVADNGDELSAFVSECTQREDGGMGVDDGAADEEEVHGYAPLQALPTLKWVAKAEKKGGAVEPDPNMDAKDQRKAERERRQREQREAQRKAEAELSEEAKAARTEKREKAAAARIEEQMKANYAQAADPEAEEGAEGAGGEGAGEAGGAGGGDASGAGGGDDGEEEETIDLDDEE